MRLISCRTDAGETLGVVVGERWLPASEVVGAGPATIADLLAGGDRALAALREGTDDARVGERGRPLADADLLAPLPRPGKIVAIGRNYRDHTTEQGVEPPPAPLIFAKWPSAVVGHGAEVSWDPGLSQQVVLSPESLLPPGLGWTM